MRRPRSSSRRSRRETLSIHHAEIKVSPTRQRRFRPPQDHQDLFTSIAEGEAGLIHAPALYVDGEDHWLVVGEGRLTVIKEMYELGMTLRYEGEEVPAGMIPYTLIGAQGPPSVVYEAEYDENMRRTPLTVAEQATATAQLFDLEEDRLAEEGGEDPDRRGPREGPPRLLHRALPGGDPQGAHRREAPGRP